MGIKLTLALSMSCRTSVRLEGFRYPGTEVSCPRYYNKNNNIINYRAFIEYSKQNNIKNKNINS